MAADIAEVSFAPFLDGTDRNGVANEIYNAFATTGFVYVKDTGIPQERVDEIFKLVSQCGWSSFSKFRLADACQRPRSFSTCL